MTDDLDIQRILKDRLDPVQTRASIPAEVVRNAKKRRVLFASLISGGLVLVLGGTGVLGASLLRRENTMRPVTPIETASPAQEDTMCEPEPEKSYGKTIPGRWLRDLFVKLGAPGGFQVSREDVTDTGTALWIDILEYDNDPTIYSLMLTPGDDPNIASSPPEEKIGERGSYTFYFQAGDPWQSYKAVSDEWELSLIAYPGADSDEIVWPDGTVEWLNRAAERAQESPPQCSGPIN